MAILKINDAQLDVPDGEPLLDAAEDLGVPFGCYAGACGTCKVKVIAGLANLGEPTDEEQEMDLEDDERLMCQACILGGVVEVEPV